MEYNFELKKINLNFIGLYQHPWNLWLHFISSFGGIILVRFLCHSFLNYVFLRLGLGQWNIQKKLGNDYFWYNSIIKRSIQSFRNWQKFVYLSVIKICNFCIFEDRKSIFNFTFSNISYHFQNIFRRLFL